MKADTRPERSTGDSSLDPTLYILVPDTCGALQSPGVIQTLVPASPSRRRSRGRVADRHLEVVIHWMRTALFLRRPSVQRCTQRRQRVQLPQPHVHLELGELGVGGRCPEIALSAPQLETPACSSMAWHVRHPGALRSIKMSNTANESGAPTSIPGARIVALTAAVRGSCFVSAAFPVRLRVEGANGSICLPPPRNLAKSWKAWLRKKSIATSGVAEERAWSQYQPRRGKCAVQLPHLSYTLPWPFLRLAPLDRDVAGGALGNWAPRCRNWPRDHTLGHRGEPALRP